MKRINKVNCFLLIVPVLLWNVIMTSRLPWPYQPATFAQDISAFINYGEMVSRVALLAITLFMPITIATGTQRLGLGIYLAGVLLYFASWLLLIYYPESRWSTGFAGFHAPAYTPVVWLLGIGLASNPKLVPARYIRGIFVLIALLFVAFHLAHTYVVYSRLQKF